MRYKFKTLGTRWYGSSPYSYLYPASCCTGQKVRSLQPDIKVLKDGPFLCNWKRLFLFPNAFISRLNKTWLQTNFKRQKIQENKVQKFHLENFSHWENFSTLPLPFSNFSTFSERSPGLIKLSMSWPKVSWAWYCVSSSHLFWFMVLSSLWQCRPLCAYLETRKK